MVHLVFYDYGVFTLCLAIEAAVYGWPRFVSDLELL